MPVAPQWSGYQKETLKSMNAIRAIWSFLTCLGRCEKKKKHTKGFQAYCKSVFVNSTTVANVPDRSVNTICQYFVDQRKRVIVVI